MMGKPDNNKNSGGPITRKQSTQEINAVTEIAADLQNPSNKDILDAILLIQKGNMLTNQKLDTVIDDIKNLASDNDANKNLIQQNKNEIELINSEVSQLKTEIEYLKQKDFNHDVIVSAIPYYPNVTADDLMNSMKKIYTPIENVLLSYVRKNEALDQFQLYIKFKDLGSKDNFMKMVRRNGPLFVNQLLPQFDFAPAVKNRKLFINDRLTKFYLELSKQLRQLQKQKQINNIRFRNGAFHVKIKKDDTSSRIVNSIADFHKIKALSDST